MVVDAEAGRSMTRETFGQVVAGACVREAVRLIRYLATAYCLNLA